jgi:hypothetical protein
MQLDSASNKNGVKRKRLREWTKFLKTWNGVGNVKCHGLFHIVFVPNGHMPFGGEQLVFGLAHTSLVGLWDLI